MIGWHLDQFNQLQAAGFDIRAGLSRRQPEFGSRAARLAQHRGRLARVLVPVDDGKVSTGGERFVHGLGMKLPNQTLPPDKLHLSHQEKRDLVAFLNALTDSAYALTPPPRQP